MPAHTSGNPSLFFIVFWFKSCYKAELFSSKYWYPDFKRTFHYPLNESYCQWPQILNALYIISSIITLSIELRKCRLSGNIQKKDGKNHVQHLENSVWILFINLAYSPPPRIQKDRTIELNWENVASQELGNNSTSSHHNLHIFA